MPSCASEITSLTPRKPRRASLREKAGPEGLGLGGSDVHAQDFAPLIAVDADGDNDGHGDDAAVLTDLHVSRVDPEIGPVALDGAIEEGFDAVVDLLAQPADLALGDAAHAHRLDEIVDGPRRDALDIGFLDHRGQGLLRQPARFEKARKVAALAKLRDAQLNGAGTRLPDAVAIAVALHEPLWRAFSESSAGEAQTSISIKRSAAKPIISRRTSASGVFSISVRRLIMSLVIGGSPVALDVATRSYR